MINAKELAICGAGITPGYLFLRADPECHTRTDAESRRDSRIPANVSRQHPKQPCGAAS